MQLQYGEKIINQAKKTRGYLQKKSSGLFSVWQRRYFIILDTTLSYYDDQSLVELKKNIPLQQINNIKLQGQRQFQLVTKKRIFELRADDEPTRDLWVASLNILINYKEWNSEKQLKVSPKRSSNSRAQSKAKKYPSITSPLLKKNVSAPTTKNQKIYSEDIDPEEFLKMVHLQKLSDRWSEESIQNKIIFLKQSKGWYFIVSCKTLLHPYSDEDLLQYEVVIPYDFNVLYYFDFGKISHPEVIQICKCKNITDVIVQNNKVSIIVGTKKLSINQISKNKTSSYYDMLIEKIKSAREIGAEYSNELKIKIKKNIDKMIHQYINHQLKIQQIAKKEIQHEICDKKDVKFRQQFKKNIENIKKKLIQIVNCCQVKGQQAKNFKLIFLKDYMNFFYKYIEKMWNNIIKVYTMIQLKRIIIFFQDFCKYVNKYIEDHRLFELSLSLQEILLAKYEVEIKKKIDLCFELKQQQICDEITIEIKDENENVSRKNSKFLSNNIYRQFHLDIRLILYEFTEMPIHQKSINYHLTLFRNTFKYIGQKTLVYHQQWKNYNTILGTCNEIQFIKNGLFEEMVSKLTRQYPSFLEKIQNEFIKQIENDINNIQAILVNKLYLLGDDKGEESKNIFEKIDITAVCRQIRQKLKILDKINIRDSQQAKQRSKQRSNELHIKGGSPKLSAKAKQQQQLKKSTSLQRIMKSDKRLIVQPQSGSKCSDGCIF